MPQNVYSQTDNICINMFANFSRRPTAIIKKCYSQECRQRNKQFDCDATCSYLRRILLGSQAAIGRSAKKSRGVSQNGLTTILGQNELTIYSCSPDFSASCARTGQQSDSPARS